MEQVFKKVAVDCLKQLAGSTQSQELTQEIRLPEAMPDVGRILQAWGQCVIRGKEWRSGCMQISGGVTVWVLYEPEDAGEPQCVEGWLPFQLRWDFPPSRRDGTMIATGEVFSVDARSLSARKIMARATAAVHAQALEPAQVDVPAPGQVREDVQLLRRNYPVMLPAEAGEKMFQLEEPLRLSGSAPALKKILSYRLQPELTECKLLAGKVVFRGIGLLHLVYLGEDGRLHTCDFEIPFSQYTDLDKEYDPQTQVILRLAVTSADLRQEESGELTLSAGLTGQYILYPRVMLEVAEDAYSNLCQIELMQEDIALPAVLDLCGSTLRAEQTADVAAAQVVDCAFYPGGVYLNAKDGNVEIEVTGTFQTLYYDAEGKLQFCSSGWSGVWTLTAENGAVQPQVQLTGKVSAAGGSSISMAADLSLQAAVMARQEQRVLAGLTLGQPTEPDSARPSLVLRRAGEQSLWEIAKLCGSTVEAICRANRLSGEPEAGKMLLIPVQ